MIRYAFFAAAAMAAFLHAEPAVDARCSLGTFAAPMSESQAFFLARATPDSLAVGPGDVRVAEAYGSGHRARPRAGELYGAIVELERAGGTASGLGGRAVVVPWDYDASCALVAYGGSMQLTEPGTLALYVATLRPREQWEGGMPTFAMVLTPALPYDGTRNENPYLTGAAQPLPPEQMFEVLATLPTYGEVAARDSLVLPPLREWMRDHPDLARHPTVGGLLSQVYYSVDRALLQREDAHPALGTWRFTVESPGHPLRTVYARTVQVPHSRWRRCAEPDDPYRQPPEPGVEPWLGLKLHLLLADTEAGLPRSPLRSYGGRQSYVGVPSPVGPIWDVALEGGVLTTAFPGDSAAAAAARLNFEQFSAAYRACDPDQLGPRGQIARVGGVLRLEQRYPLPSGGEIVVRGEHISRESVRWVGR